MSCKYNKCSFKEHTTDGFCTYHKMYSKDKLIITSIILSFLKDFYKSDTKLEKIDILIKLTKYLNLNINFINNTKNLKITLIEKYQEFIISVNNCDSNKINEFTNLSEILLNKLLNYDPNLYPLPENGTNSSNSSSEESSEESSL